MTTTQITWKILTDAGIDIERVTRDEYAIWHLLRTDDGEDVGTRHLASFSVCLDSGVDGEEADGYEYLSEATGYHTWYAPHELGQMLAHIAKVATVCR